MLYEYERFGDENADTTSRSTYRVLSHTERVAMSLDPPTNQRLYTPRLWAAFSLPYLPINRTKHFRLADDRQMRTPRAE